MSNSQGIGRNSHLKELVELLELVVLHLQLLHRADGLPQHRQLVRLGLLIGLNELSQLQKPIEKQNK